MSKRYKENRDFVFGDEVFGGWNKTSTHSAILTPKGKNSYIRNLINKILRKPPKKGEGPRIPNAHPNANNYKKLKKAIKT